MDPRCLTGFIALFAALAITPGFAQNLSSPSDDQLRLERDRLMSHGFSNSQREGYRNRVTASDYELEFQMQQLDKQRAEDDQARAYMLQQELDRREDARGFGQDVSSLNDDHLRLERDRLMGHSFSNSQRRGYRNRVTASDYELEFQMQQLDKQRAEDDQARAYMLQQELDRREDARNEARRQAEQNRREAQARQAEAESRAYFENAYRAIDESYARMRQERAERDAEQRAQAEQRERDMQQVEDFWQRSRQPTAPPPENPWQLPPVEPVTGPSFPGAYFPAPPPPNGSALYPSDR